MHWLSRFSHTICHLMLKGFHIDDAPLNIHQAVFSQIGSDIHGARMDEFSFVSGGQRH